MEKLSEQDRARIRHGFVRLDYTAIRVGYPLKFPVYTGDGHLLLNKGYIVRTDEQLDTLIKRGIYMRKGDDRPARSAGSGAPAAQAVNVNPFSEFADLVHQFQGIVERINQRDPEADRKIRLLVNQIELFCDEEPDASIARIHLQPPSTPSEQAIAYALLSTLVARHLDHDVQRTKRLTAAALTANLALIPFQDKLHQSRQSLNDKQREVINKHPLLSATALRQTGITDEFWLRIVEEHHERFDGSGYPNGLKGKSILLEAKVIGLVEHYLALTTQRGYRAKLTPTDAYQEILAAVARDSDTSLTQALIDELTIYPPGVFVKLANGEVALVTHRSRGEAGDTPKCRAILNPRGGFYAAPLQRYTDEAEYRVVEIVTPESLPALNYSSIWGLTG